MWPLPSVWSRSEPPWTVTRAAEAAHSGGSRSFPRLDDPRPGEPPLAQLEHLALNLLCGQVESAVSDSRPVQPDCALSQAAPGLGGADTEGGRQQRRQVDDAGVGRRPLHLGNLLRLLTVDVNTIELSLPPRRISSGRTPICSRKRLKLSTFLTESGIRASKRSVSLLRDEKLRAEFHVRLKQFLATLDGVLPRPEALPYLADGTRCQLLIQYRTRAHRKLTGQGLDCRKVRSLLPFQSAISRLFW